jgi:amylosucrase
LALHNFGEQPLTVELAAIGDGRWKLLIDESDAAVESLRDDMRLVLPAYAVRWLERSA